MPALADTVTEYDHDLFLIIADQFLDQGDEVGSEGWRWLAQKRRFPVVAPPYGRWYWSNFYGDFSASREDETDVLPDVFDKPFKGQEKWARYYDKDGLQTALGDFLSAWRELDREGRKEAWAWVP